MATTLDAPDTTQISRMSAQLSSLKEVIRPKDLHPSRFIPLMEQWLDRRQPLTREECIKRGISCLPGGGRTPEYVKVESELMHQMPIKGEQLSKIPTLLPDLTAQCKPPTMCFGWVICADEIEQLGRAKGQYMELTPVDYYEPEDPDRPQDVDAVFEDGVYEVRGEPYFSPEWTADRLLLQAKKELRLNDKYVGRCPYFTTDGVNSGFDQRDTVFVSIYSNLDLLPQQQAKAPLPTRDDIKRMQEWLGLKGEHREPGWWFSVAGLARTSWRQYWIEGDM